MHIRVVILVLALCGSVHCEEGRSIEKNLSALANMVIPSVHFTDETTMEEAVAFINQRLRETDPQPPRWWKIRMDLSDAALATPVPLKQRNVPFHRLIGALADSVDADVLVTRQGYVIRGRNKKDEQADAGNRGSR